MARTSLFFGHSPTHHMSDPQQSDPNSQMLQGDPSPEEREAAQFADEADAQGALASVQAELAAVQAKNIELSDQYLRAQADVQNARRRADDEITKARKFAVEAFAESLLPVTAKERIKYVQSN